MSNATPEQKALQQYTDAFEKAYDRGSVRVSPHFVAPIRRALSKAEPRLMLVDPLESGPLGARVTVFTDSAVAVVECDKIPSATSPGDLGERVIRVVPRSRISAIEVFAEPMPEAWQASADALEGWAPLESVTLTYDGLDTPIKIAPGRVRRGDPNFDFEHFYATVLADWKI